MNSDCLVCSATNISQCTQCNSVTFLYEYDCYDVCPNGTYVSGVQCFDCDPSCVICTGSPSPCSECQVGFYLYASACGATCPVGYFPYDATRECRDCSIYCVVASLTLQISSDGKSLIAKLTFSQQIDFSNFPVESFFYIDSDHPNFDISLFNQEYSVVNSNTLQLKMTAISLMNLTAANFYTAINPKTQDRLSILNNYFSDTIYLLTDAVVWTIIVKPAMTEEEQKFIDKLKNLNNQINNGLGQKWVQEIKKSGFFAFLFSGAQLSSTVVLCNSLPARNMYEGARFWASFIYF